MPQNSAWWRFLPFLLFSLSYFQRSRLSFLLFFFFFIPGPARISASSSSSSPLPSGFKYAPRLPWDKVGADGDTRMMMMMRESVRKKEGLFLLLYASAAAAAQSNRNPEKSSLPIVARARSCIFPFLFLPPLFLIQRSSTPSAPCPCPRPTREKTSGKEAMMRCEKDAPAN